MMDDAASMDAKPPQGRLRLFDLSSLINSALFPGDLTIEHTHSGKSWTLPSDILVDLYPTLSIAKLQSTIKATLLPEDSISTFINYLFKNSSYCRPWRDSVRCWSHTCWLWSEIGLPSIDAIFATTLLTRIPTEVLGLALLDVWNDALVERTTDDLIVRALALQIKARCMESFEQLLASNLTPRNLKIAMYVPSNIQDIPASMGADCRNQFLGLSALDTTVFRLGRPNVSHVLTRSFDFLFTLPPQNSSSYGIIADMRYMHTQWSWFKRLMDVEGCEERRTRTAHMPPWMTPSMLLAILRCIQGKFVKPAHFQQADAFALLEHRREMDLVNAADKAKAPFSPLLKFCRSLCFPLLTDSNRLEHLANYVRLQMDSKAEKVMDSILASTTSFDYVAAIMLLPIEAIARMQAKIREGDGQKPAASPNSVQHSSLPSSSK